MAASITHDRLVRQPHRRTRRDAALRGADHAVKRAHIVCSLREGAIRLSPHCYNTVEEMERVLDVLDQLE